MDHPRLVGLFFIFCLGLGSCSTHQELQTKGPPRTILQSKLKPTTLAILSEQFLEWQKGYNIQIRDHQQGLLVTEWTLDNPLDRHRIQLRVSEDVNGSFVSAHIVHEVFSQTRWSEIPSSGASEAQLLSELEAYLLKSNAAGNP